jgi:hypothetical protein
VLKGQQPDRVSPGNFVDLRLVEVPELLCRGLPGMRPRAVLVRVVGLESTLSSPTLSRSPTPTESLKKQLYTWRK